jgi:aldehyde dehydrogenase (NAD+)
MSQLSKIVDAQRRFFQSGRTLSISFRKEQLRKLRSAVVANEKRILVALYRDLQKSSFEAYMSEVGIVLSEIRFALRHLRSWARPKRVKTPLTLFPSTSHIHSEPYGVSLIISPWNYPFALTINPLIGAVAAGNCCVLKVPEFAPFTSSVLADLIADVYTESYITVLSGDAEISQNLLKERFDKILFTGSAIVGRAVMTAAATNLTPITLELGGKSPCIVDQDARLEEAARKIVSGKFLNAGQTCIAPDYLLVHQKVKNDLTNKIQNTIHRFYGINPQQSEDYSRIINQRHFDRLENLMSNGQVIFGGDRDRKDLYMGPTLIDHITTNDVIMKDEIFGPLLPILTFDHLAIAASVVRSLPKPLALYFFSGSRRNQRSVMNQISFGGGCINDTMLQYASPYLPFGGVGNSGMGSYRGKAGFDTFSHRKSVVRRPARVDLPLRHPPYKSLSLIKKILR